MTSRADGNLTKWLFDTCKKMAELSSTPEGKARWLKLAVGWLAVMESQQTPADESEAQVLFDGIGKERSRSSN